MKTIYGMIIVSILLLVTGCGQKVNDPADIEAIRNLTDEWDSACLAGDAGAIVSGYANDAIRMEPNQPALQGKDAMQAFFQAYFDIGKWEGDNVVEDVRVSGDLAVSRGTTTYTETLKEVDISRKGTAKWAAAFQLQTDGTWKCIYDIWNSDLPVADTLPIGEEELALLQVERDWVDAALNNDLEKLDEILAQEYMGISEEGPGFNKAQIIRDMRRGRTKIESVALSDLKVLVIGERAIVNGVTDAKGTLGGQDMTGKYLWTDIFVKRDGRWQCVTGYSNKVG